jgi:hypothetical protein
LLARLNFLADWDLVAIESAHRGILNGSPMPRDILIHPELLRQRGRLVWLLEKLDAKNCDKMEANARLLSRRKSYVPKNNGKGRPAKKLKRFSQEDEARRVKYITEIKLLDDILEGAPGHSLITWLKAATELTTPVDQAARFRQTKIANLLEQFGGKAIDLRTPQPWSANEVRTYLHVAKQRQADRLAYFRRVPVRTLGEQECEARETTAMLVIERLLGSHHVQTAADFMSFIEFLRQDRPSSPSTLTKSVWSASLDALVAEMAKRFQLPKAGS